MSLIVYQIGGLFTGDVSFNVFTIVALLLLVQHLDGINLIFQRLPYPRFPCLSGTCHFHITPQKLRRNTPYFVRTYDV